MPFNTIEEVTPLIRSIKPAVSLTQANMIMGTMEDIKEDDKNGSDPLALAISGFKREYTVRNRKWVTRKSVKEKKEAKQESLTEGAEAEECHIETSSDFVPTFGATTFDDLDASRELDEKALELKSLINDLKAMIDNIAFSFQETDKIGAMNDLFAGFIVRAEAVLEDDRETEEGEPVIEMSEMFDTSGAFNLVSINEGSKSDLLMMDIKPIAPGWGNTRDNNYYPAEMLKRDAAKFAGVKMYETDHRQSEKSTRTWVSTIQDVIGFTKDGSPIVRVAVHHPEFAERVRNLNEAGILEKMECSIFGTAQGRGGFEQDGRKGRLIEAIADISSVDWVTRAGAGGHAVSLAENENGGSTMKDEKNVNEANSETSDIPIEEQEEQKQEDKSPEEPQKLGEDDVRLMIDNSKLPKTMQDRLKLAEYADEDALKEAIQLEENYIAEITAIASSGQVFGMSENKQVDHTMSAAETEANMDKVNARFIGGQR